MKKLYFFLAFLLATTAINAQCNIDTTFLANTPTGMYPTANYLPHIVRDSLYDQTVQGKIIGTIDTMFAGIVSAHIEVDSVILDSLAGLPNGITWSKNPYALLGGHYACVEFSGTTSDTPGVYNLRAFGRAWVKIQVPLLSINTDTLINGDLMRYPPFNRYSLTVDSVQSPLSVAVNGRNVCFGQQNGSVSAHASGGSPVSPYSYIWNTGSTAYTLTNLSPGTYTVTVFSGADSSVASYVVTAPSAPITGTVSSVGSNGTNGVAIVNVTGGQPPYRYRWTGGQNTDTATGLAPGTYTVRVTDSSGCTFTDSVVVANLTGLVSLNADVLQLDMFPNPANNILNVSIDAPKTIALRVEAVDMTGRVVYSAPLTVTNHTNFAINVDKFNSGMYILQLSAENASVHQRFVVTH